MREHGLKCFLLENLWFADIIPGSEGNFYIQFSKKKIGLACVEKWISQSDKGAHCATKFFIFTCQYQSFHTACDVNLP